MMDIVDMVMRPQVLVTMLSAIATFATVLTLTMPLLTRDRMSQRMKVMAVEREKLRAVRIADLGAKSNQGNKLRQTPKGFMQQIVDQLDLRSKFDTEEVRDQLK
ncbi:MAG: type II secretion system F family protein, partial [Armatimonadaceae bacterium]